MSQVISQVIDGIRCPHGIIKCQDCPAAGDKHKTVDAIHEEGEQYYDQKTVTVYAQVAP